MINDVITLGSFMADLMEWYCKLVEADHLQDYEIDRNYEKLNVRQMLIDDAIAEIGTILSYFDSDTVKSMFSEFESNETAAKYQEQIIRAIRRNRLYYLTTLLIRTQQENLRKNSE